MKRMGTFTFTDALDHKYNSRSIKFTAAISTLVVSIFYLIPQMVGAGDLVVPILGLPHWTGVVIVGSVVIFIVATAGMISTTYVQFFKGGLLIIFSVVLTAYILRKGLETEPNPEHHHYISLGVTNNPFGEIILEDDSLYVIKEGISTGNNRFFLLEKDGINNWFHLVENEEGMFLNEMLTIVTDSEGNILYNGAPRTDRLFYQVGHASRVISDGEEVESSGPANPFNFLTWIEDSEIVRYIRTSFDFGDSSVVAWYPEITPGTDIMKPGLFYRLEGASLMEDRVKVRAGKIAAFSVGILGIIIGILLQGMNVSFLVGLAFAVAASSNLPAIIMILFWDKTTGRGVSASIVMGIVSSVLLILLSPSLFERYGLAREAALFPMDNPGIVSIPLSFLTLIVVSILTRKKELKA